MKTFQLLSLLSALAVSAMANDAAVKPQPANGKVPEPPAVLDADAKLAEELFANGRQLFFQGQHVKAVEKLIAAAEANPAKTSYKLLLAKAHRYADQTEKAVAVLEEILEANPDHVEAGVQLAELLTPLKEPDRVIAVLTPLLKFKHDYPLYRLLAEAYYQKERFDEARTHYEEAVKLNAENANDHYQLGNIYLAQKRFAKAAAAYEAAGTLGYSSAVYHFKLGSVYFNLRNYLGRVTTAEVLGGQVGEIKNNMFLIDPVPGRKDTFYVAGPPSAVFQVAQAQKLGIDVFEIRFLEGTIWLGARRFRKADALYATLADDVTKEDTGLFWYYWSQTALGLDDYDNYLTRLDQAIEAEPDVYQPTRTDALVTIANRYHQRGETERYIEFLDKAVAANPLSARLHLTLGDAYWLANDHEQAIRQYKLVLELEPDHADRVRLLNRLRGQANPPKTASAMLRVRK